MCRTYVEYGFIRICSLFVYVYNMNLYGCVDQFVDIGSEENVLVWRWKFVWKICRYGYVSVFVDELNVDLLRYVGLYAIAFNRVAHIYKMYSPIFLIIIIII